MFSLTQLNCPTCGAQLRVKKDEYRFDCEHCGNHYLLEQKIGKLNSDERENLQPVSTSTRNLKQWLRVGDYEICLHEIRQAQVDSQVVFAINVECRNNSKQNLSFRGSQWTLYDADGYSYENKHAAHLPDGLPGKPLGSERIIPPGSNIRGWVIFDLNPNAVIERLQFLTGYLTSKTAEYHLK